MNTGIWKCLNFSMYNTSLEMNTDYIEWDMDELRSVDMLPEDFDPWEDIVFETEKYKTDLAKFGMNYINEQLKEKFQDKELPFEIVIQNAKIWSPKYYNFQGDELDFEMVVPNNYLDILEKIVNENNCYIYFRKEKGSYDGFHSFFPMPSDNMPVKEYLDMCIKDNKIEYVIGAVLESIGITFNQNDFENDWQDELGNHDSYAYSPKLQELYNNAREEGLV